MKTTVLVNKNVSKQNTIRFGGRYYDLSEQTYTVDVETGDVCKEP